MEMLDKNQEILQAGGAPRNALLDRAEEVANAHLPSVWKIFPFVVFALLVFGVFAAWQYTSFLVSSAEITFRSLPYFVAAVGGGLSLGVFALLLFFVFSYLSILKTSRMLYYQNQMFSLAIDGVNDGMWDWDVAKNTVTLSPAWLEMFGYKKTGISNDPNEWFALIHPEDIASVTQGFELHFQKRNAVFHVEHRVKTVGGEYKWVLDRGHAVWDKHGKVTRIAGSTTDISRIKEVEDVLQSKTEELQKANEIVKQEKVKYEALLTSIGDGMIATNKDGEILVMNPQAGRMLGRDIEDSIGKFFTDIVPLEQNEKEVMIPLDERPVLQTLLSGSRVTMVSYYFKADGTKFPVAVTSAPIMLDGRIIGAVVVFRDITKEKEIDKSKTEFVSLASHQLRTPLSAIRWYSEMLDSEKLGALNASQKDYLSEIYKSNRRMIDLVNALLNVSRIDMGTFAIEPEPTDIKEIAVSVLKELYVKIQESDLHVESYYEDNLPKVNVDPKLMRIIIQNLLSNAMKYTPKGGSVAISITKDSQNMLIKVSDSGVGIPANVQDKIFTKLFRADNARVVESEGTGLGLYIIKSIVERGGGRTWFVSEENKGTAFFVEIPLLGMQSIQGAKDLA
jgi:PAS domain S-box-containing protein